MNDRNITIKFNMDELKIIAHGLDIYKTEYFDYWGETKKPLNQIIKRIDYYLNKELKKEKTK